MKHVARRGALVMAGTLGGYGMTYIFYVTAARALGVERYGLVSALLGVVLVCALPSNFVTVIVARRVARADAHGDSPAIRRIERGTVRTLGAATVVALPAALLLSRPIGGFFHVADPSLFVLTAAAAVMVGVLPLQRAVMQGTRDFGGFATSNVIEGATRGLAGIGTLIVADARLAMAGFAAGGALAFTWGAARIARRHGTHVRGAVEAIDRRAAFAAAAPLAALTAMTFSDVIVVRHVLSAVDAGLYVAVSLAGRALITIGTAIPFVLLPEAIRRREDGEDERPLLAAATGAACALAGTVWLVCAIVPGFVVRILAGPAFSAGAALLPRYTIAAAELAVATVLATFLAGVRRSAVGIPLVALAIAEPAAIAAFARHADDAVIVVVAGHTAAFAATVLAVIVAERGDRRARVSQGNRRRDEEETS